MKQIIFVMLSVLGLAACTAVAPQPAIDEVDVYTAVIRQIYTVDDTFGGTLQPPLVYIINQTDDSIGDPDIEQEPSQLIDAADQEAIVNALADLSAQWVWVNGRDEVPINPDTGLVEDEGVIITLGNIHPQDDGTVFVSGSIYVGMLAAGGQTFILEQTDSGWAVIGTTGVQWIS